MTAHPPAQPHNPPPPPTASDVLPLPPRAACNLNTVAAHCLANAQRWNPELFDRSHPEVLLHLVVGLNEEAGEVSGPIKKWDRERDYGVLPFMTGAVAPEIADVLMYVLQLAAFLGIDVEQALAAKIARNDERWP